MALRSLFHVPSLCSDKGFSAEITQFLYFLHQVDFLRIEVSKQLEIFRKLLSIFRVHKTKSTAMLGTLVSVEEHQHAKVAHVAFAESMLIKAMNLRICENIANSLQVNNHQVAISQLP